jgi:hypothetical protein
MQCPKCGALTHVSEKRGPFRTRRCPNPYCRNDFTTCENIMAHSEDGCVGAKVLARRSRASETLSAKQAVAR